MSAVCAWGGAREGGYFIKYASVCFSRGEIGVGGVRDHGAGYVLSTHKKKRRGTSARIKAHQTYLCKHEFIVFYACFPCITERQKVKLGLGLGLGLFVLMLGLGLGLGFRVRVYHSYNTG